MHERRFRAPARVNLIGGQIDYHEGIVVSMAIDRDVVVDVARRDDDRIVAHSVDLDGTVDIPAGGAEAPAAVAPAWGRPIAGVARVLEERGHRVRGIDLHVSSDVPIGAGLSSSAAFEVAVTLALADRSGIALDTNEVAHVAQRAEHLALGVPCGIQDQLTSLAGRSGCAVRIDCRSLVVEPIPIPRSIAVVVVHSGVARTLEGSPWQQRREESLAVAHDLGLRVLRDARPDQVAGRPRGRHAVNEIGRVVEFAGALRAGEVDALGPLMLASHASSRDDMEVSIPELDTLVDVLMEAGAHGARLTGGGFGGCVVALVPRDEAEAIAARAGDAYRMRAQREPTSWIVSGADGAGRARD
jgi:galactokinase